MSDFERKKIIIISLFPYLISWSEDDVESLQFLVFPHEVPPIIGNKNRLQDYNGRNKFQNIYLFVTGAQTFIPRFKKNHLKIEK